MVMMNLRDMSANPPVDLLFSTNSPFSTVRLTVVNRKSDGCKPPRDASWTQNHVYSSGRPAALLSRKRPPSLRPLALGAWHHAATARATAMARGRISRSHGTGGARKTVSGQRRHLKLPAGGKFFPAPKPSRGNCKPNSPRSPGAKPDFRGRDHRRREPPSHCP